MSGSASPVLEMETVTPPAEITPPGSEEIEKELEVQEEEQGVEKEVEVEVEVVEKSEEETSASEEETRQTPVEAPVSEPLVPLEVQPEVRPEIIEDPIKDQEEEEVQEEIEVPADPEQLPEVDRKDPEPEEKPEAEKDPEPEPKIPSPEEPVSEDPIECVNNEKMDEFVVKSELESLHLQDEGNIPTTQNNNNENEDDKINDGKQQTQQQIKPKSSGIKPPTTVLRYPTPPAVKEKEKKVEQIVTPRSARPATATPTPRPVPSPRPASKMARERSELTQKSTSTRSIDNVGKFTPKVNAKFVNVKSKVGSITTHRPGGGNVEIFSEKREYKAQPKVGSMANTTHVPGGGNTKIESRRLDFSYASPKVGSKTSYVAPKSEVKIQSEKLEWNVKSKVGSLENTNHKPTGGNVQVVCSEAPRPKLAAALIMERKKQQPKRRSVSKRNSNTNVLHNKQYPGEIYPLTSDFILNGGKRW